MAQFRISHFDFLFTSVCLYQVGGAEYQVHLLVNQKNLEHLNKVHEVTGFDEAIKRFHYCVDQALLIEQDDIDPQLKAEMWGFSYDGWADAQEDEDRTVREALKRELASRM